MAQCEDFPCCGHERGCCPDYDPDTGAQLNMVCTCGAKIPITNGCSICDACLTRMDETIDGFDATAYDGDMDCYPEMNLDLEAGEREIFDIESGQE